MKEFRLNQGFSILCEDSMHIQRLVQSEPYVEIFFEYLPKSEKRIARIIVARRDDFLFT